MTFDVSAFQEKHMHFLGACKHLEDAHLDVGPRNRVSKPFADFFGAEHEDIYSFRKNSVVHIQKAERRLSKSIDDLELAIQGAEINLTCRTRLKGDSGTTTLISIDVPEISKGEQVSQYLHALNSLSRLDKYDAVAVGIIDSQKLAFAPLPLYKNIGRFKHALFSGINYVGLGHIDIGSDNPSVESADLKFLINSALGVVTGGADDSIAENKASATMGDDGMFHFLTHMKQLAECAEDRGYGVTFNYHSQFPDFD